MSTRTPLSFRRLSPVELGLGVTIILLFLTVIALVVVSFSAANTARSAFEGAYVMTDLANIERGVYRLHLATHGVVNTSAPDWEQLQRDEAWLANQLQKASEQASSDPELSQGIAILRNILSEYSLIVLRLDQHDRPAPARTLGEQLQDVLLRLETQTQALYAKQEQRFFGRISTALDHQRRSQGMLLVMITTLLVFSAALAVLLRHSLSQEFERAYTMLEALYGADEELHRHLRPEHVFQSLVDVVVDLFGADKSALLVWESDGSRLVVGAARGYDDEAQATMACSLGEGLMGQAASTGRPIIVEDALQDGRAGKDMVSREKMRAFMHVPIHLSGKIYGILNVCFMRPRGFDSDDVRLVQALANRAASAIENARLYQQIEAAATAEERQRLARELHDAVTQTLFSASLIAEVLPRIWDRAPEQGRQRLEELRELTRGALAEMRTLLLELRPAALVEAQLGDLLEQLGEAITGRARLPISVTIEGEGECVLPPEIKVAIYRVAQESLNNIAKHADATQASISLRCWPEHLHLTISDDGRGFDVRAIAPDHLGLAIMRERAEAIGAALHIDTAVGRGTRVELVWGGPSARGSRPSPLGDDSR